jgi:hypothetical protein
MANAYPSQIYGLQGQNAGNFVPVYGGDCALSQTDGLASSLKRLSEVSQQIVNASYALRDSFGMSAPQAQSDYPPSSGVKSDIDRAESEVRNALCNLNMVLEHLHS